MRTVILDAGHGVETPGKRSPIWKDGTQLLEYEFNRDIVRRIAEHLDRTKVPYVIISPEQEDISLRERVARANEIYSRDKSAFLVSVHANAGGGTGWEVFTSVGETESDKLASLFYEKAEKYLSGICPIRKCMADGDPDKEEQFYILRKTACPAVLTENLFMDTEKDCRFIMSEAGRHHIAMIHVDAILNINQ